MKAFRTLLFFIVFYGFFPVYANSLYPLNDPRKDAQFEHLLKDLRCLVCQNQDLADSNASLAQDLRSKIYLMVKDNKTDDEIRTYLSQRYGDFILFKPPVKALTLILWFGPLIFLLAGFIIFWRSCFRRDLNE